MKEYYKMVWGDVLRMAKPDFRIPPNTIQEIEFCPEKEDYDKNSNNPATLKEALRYSFLAASNKIIVSKWVVDVVGELPQIMKEVKQKKTRGSVEFIKIEEPEEVINKKATKKVVEEVVEEKEEQPIEKERSKIWQQ